MKRRIVVGAGAVGGYLAHHDHDVTLVDGWFEHIEAMPRDGLHITGVTAEENLSVSR